MAGNKFPIFNKSVSLCTMFPDIVHIPPSLHILPPKPCLNWQCLHWQTKCHFAIDLGTASSSVPRISLQGLLKLQPRFY